MKEYSLAIQSMKEVLKLDPQHQIGNQLLQDYRLKWHHYIGSTAKPHHF
jgi:hypothetical protein